MVRGFLFGLLVAAIALVGLEPLARAQFTRVPSAYPEQYPPPQYPSQTYPQMQQPQMQQPQMDAPDVAADEQHGVARISVVQGDVNVRRGDNGQLEAAAVNVPLMARDHLQTSSGSRAEIELDYGNLIRLGPNTDIGMADLQYHRYQVQLGAGSIIYRVLRDANSQAEIDTPSIAVRPLAQGEYRISVMDDGTTQITVRSGQAEIDGPRGSERLDAGRTTLVRGDPTDPEFQTIAEIPRDQLDDWSENRDRDLLASQSYQRASPDIPGADDLDTYGTWVPSQYGQVWQPQAPQPDWSPYSDGQWTWENYYGWTWIDNAPWGWAPYHYGRWFWNTGYGWCWWPGAVRARYAWSPALVGFFGWGGGVGAGWGGIGWVALAPFEVCHPWWGRGFYGGRSGFRSYEFDRRSADIGHLYRNASVRGGAMTAGYGGFGGPGQRFRAATRAQVTNATFFRGAMPVSPTSNAFRFSSRHVIPNARFTTTNRRFFQSPQAHFRGFERQQPGASQAARDVPLHGVPPNRTQTFAGQGSPSATAPARESAGGGWQRFGNPSNSGGLRENFTSQSEPSGWHRFGQPPQRTAPRANYGGRSEFGAPVVPRYSTPPVPRYSAPATPRYSAPATPRYSAPAMPHYSAPRYNAPHSNSPRYSAPPRSSHGGNGGSRGGGGDGSRDGGNGGSHGGGGGHSPGGHRR